MAKPGSKPHPAVLRGINGGKKSDNTPPPNVTKRTEPLEPPKKLNKTQQKIWDEYIEPAWWLTKWDIPIAFQFTCVYAEYVRAPGKMIASRQAEMRRCMNELHLSSAEQARIGVVAGDGDPAEKYFN